MCQYRPGTRFCMCVPIYYLHVRNLEADAECNSTDLVADALCLTTEPGSTIRFVSTGHRTVYAMSVPEIPQQVLRLIAPYATSVPDIEQTQHAYAMPVPDIAQGSWSA
eukprot:859208-Rhodomonas_salina.1